MKIDVFGDMCGGTGWTTHSLGFARALNELVPVNFRAHGPRRDAARRCLRMAPRAMFLRGLVNSPAEFGVVILGRPYPGQRSARWVVWETTVLPSKVRHDCDAATFVWTPSAWGRRTLIANGIPAEKIRVVPEGVDTDAFRPSGRPKQPGRFRFLFVGKWEPRKFVAELARAFVDEFDGNDDVELVLHAHNPYVPGFSTRRELERLELPRTPRIIVSEPGNSAALRELYQSADILVFPTRAEGWGLPILEAMATGLPVIVTDYSAPVDFVTPEVGYLVQVKRMVDARCETFGIDTGQWAEPDLDHLRFQMRQAFENPQEVCNKGVRARQEALSWSWPNSATVALRTIRADCG